MRVLITGGAGYIGNLVARKLVATGHEPVILDTFNWGREALEDISSSAIIIEGDCRSSKNIIYALEGVDAVIHLGGIVGEPACKINYKAHHTINVESTRTLLSCMTNPHLDLIKDFIFLSSCSVYGNVAGLYDEVTEDTPTAPLSYYAEGKLLSEQIIWEYYRKCPHLSPTILRLTTVFGWSPRPRLDLVTNLFVYKALKEGKITIFGDGKQYRSLIHVDDVAEAVMKVFTSPRFMREGRLFHVGEESNNKTVAEIASIVKRVLPDTEIEFKTGQPTDRRDYRINCKRLQNVLGWKAKYSVEDGIVELADKLQNLEWDWESPKYRNNLFDYK